jgi:hypothetical protein
MTINQLQQARALVLPTRQEMLNRAGSVQQFWQQNQSLLTQAWQAWEKSEQFSVSQRVNTPDDFLTNESFLDESLRLAVQAAWNNPEQESQVQTLWQEVAPNVFQSQFFNPERLGQLRQYLDNVMAAQIPLRPPYGIVLNRGGAMLDKRSEGYLAAPSFQVFYQAMLDKYMRPIARLLFPEIVGYDTQTFGFSIQYQPNKDTAIRLHTDASAVTLNINLNLPGEKFSGSELDFYDPLTGTTKRLTFKPGTAMIHRGNVAHAAQPITQGERSNLVLWLYGERGSIPPHNATSIPIDANQRWTIPTVPSDKFAPF